MREIGARVIGKPRTPCTIAVQLQGTIVGVAVMVWRRLATWLIGILAAVGFATLSGMMRDAVEPTWGPGAVFIGNFVMIVLGVLIAYKMRDEKLRERAREQERQHSMAQASNPDYAGH